MDAHTETTAHIGNVSVMVDAGKKPEAIHDENVSIDNIFLGCLRISDHLPVGECCNLLQMILPDDMWGNYQFPVGMFVEILHENLLVRQPTAASDKDFLLCV